MMKLLVVACLASFCVSACAQPIFDYVSAPDPSFAWAKAPLSEDAEKAGEIHLEMTSQVWQGITWKHRIAIARPAKPRHPELCLLVITGGNPAGEEFMIARLMSILLGIPIAVLGDIPNQPLFDNLREDGLISYTFSKYLETGDQTWPCLFPMTKAAVRAMDAVTELSETEWGEKVEGFVVTGASKRGWTTWFTAEVDKRVKGIVPMVYDNLNLPAQMQHHLAQWGRYSEQIRDYTERGLPDLLGTDEGRALAEIVDPYTYRDRAKMPKLIMTGTNDRYWPLNAADDYFDDLVGPKHILYVPNSGHGLEDRRRVLGGMAGFIAACAGDRAMPKLEWGSEAVEGGLKLWAKGVPEPKQVLAWTASAGTKDFREAKWSSQPVEPAEGRYSHVLASPAEGFAAGFLELSFEENGQDFPLSTLVCIVGGGQ